MNSWWKILIIALSIAVTITPATAREQNVTNGHQSHSDTAIAISERKAIAIAQQHFKGRVLSINQTGDLYRVKILSDQGAVHMVLINVLDGRVVSMHHHSN